MAPFPDIGIVGYYGKHAIDIILPVVSEDELSSLCKKNIQQNFNLSNKITIFAHFQNGERRLKTLHLQAASAKAKVALFLVQNSSNLSLYVYKDGGIDDIIKLPTELYFRKIQE